MIYKQKCSNRLKFGRTAQFRRPLPAQQLLPQVESIFPCKKEKILAFRVKITDQDSSNEEYNTPDPEREDSDGPIAFSAPPVVQERRTPSPRPMVCFIQ